MYNIDDEPLQMVVVPSAVPKTGCGVTVTVADMQAVVSQLPSALTK
jgi:hypothetical protein